MGNLSSFAVNSMKKVNRHKASNSVHLFCSNICLGWTYRNGDMQHLMDFSHSTQARVPCMSSFKPLSMTRGSNNVFLNSLSPCVLGRFDCLSDRVKHNVKSHISLTTFSLFYSNCSFVGCEWTFF